MNTLDDRIKALEAERDSKSAQLKALRAEQAWLKKNSDRVDARILAQMTKERDDTRQWAEHLRPNVIERLRAEDRAKTDAARQSQSSEAPSDDSDEPEAKPQGEA